MWASSSQLTGHGTLARPEPRCEHTFERLRTARVDDPRTHALAFHHEERWLRCNSEAGGQVGVLLELEPLEEKRRVLTVPLQHARNKGLDRLRPLRASRIEEDDARPVSSVAVRRLLVGERGEPIHLVGAPPAEPQRAAAPV